MRLKDYIQKRKDEGMGDAKISIGESTFFGLIDMVKDIGRRIEVLEQRPKSTEQQAEDFLKKMMGNV